MKRFGTQRKGGKAKEEKKNEEEAPDRKDGDAFRLQIGNLREVREANKEGLDLGLEELHKILPDTWNNISWPLQNSVENIVAFLVKRRADSEDEKIYTIETAEKIRDALCEFIEQTNGEFARNKTKAEQ